MLSNFSPRRLKSDGSLNTGTMLAMFREFWRENEEIWARQGWKEKPLTETCEYKGIDITLWGF